MKLATFFVTELAETSVDAATLTALGELMARHHDAKAMLIMGKTALTRGLSTERYALFLRLECRPTIL